MIALFDRLALPVMRALDPERAHRLAVAALKVSRLPRPAADDPRLEVQAFGLDFPNPVGLAAGFDKNGEVGGRDPAARVRLRRDRNRDAAAAGGQSAAAPVPPASATKA